MNMFARLELKQRQALVITPQLQQAIKLLQLSALDLQAYIENELKENPLLTEGADSTADRESGLDNEAHSFALNELPTFDAKSVIEAEPFRHIEGMTYDHEGSDEAFPGRGSASEVDFGASEWPSNDYSTLSSKNEDYDALSTIAETQTLQGHLSRQADLIFKTPVDRFVAEYLIDLVDRDGYIRTDIAEVASALALPISDIERILCDLQTLDPAGVCARTLAECLTLQLKEQNRFDPCMERLLRHLDILAACDYPRLRKLCAVDADDLQDMIADIRRLNPRPGLAFETKIAETLVPDVIVRRGSDDGWLVEINPAAAPAIAVDRAYYQALKMRCRTESEKSYLSDRFACANWLAKSLDQRLSTIMKVATAVVEEQEAFFNHGVRHLKPLNLRQIATKIGMHESTVSRVTSNKAMATPRGLFEMKYFFTSAIPAAGSSRELHSSEAVRDRIKELISREHADHILSDDRIVALLQEDGIDIARRTVAKYREALRIPSSASRRRQKRNTATAQCLRAEA